MNVKGLPQAHEEQGTAVMWFIRLRDLERKGYRMNQKVIALSANLHLILHFVSIWFH